MAAHSASLTAKTLHRLREDGWPLVEVVERWNPAIKVRHDLWGFVDVLAVGPHGVLAVQTTSRANMSSRRNKMLEHPNLAHVRAAGIMLELDGWDQPGGKGTRWRVKTEKI